MHLNIYLLSIYSCIHVYACGYKLVYIKAETLCGKVWGFTKWCIICKEKKKKFNIDFLMLRLDVMYL